MKRLLLALLVTTGIIGGITYLAPTEATAAPTTVVAAVVDSPCGVNPYDNYALPVMPWPYCGVEMHLDSACVAANQAAFNTEAQDAITTAKIAWNQACGKRTKAFAAALKLFENCDHPANPQCMIHFNQDNLDAELAFRADIATAASNLNATIAALQASYIEKLKECCVDDE